MTSLCPETPLQRLRKADLLGASNMIMHALARSYVGSSRAYDEVWTVNHTCLPIGPYSGHNKKTGASLIFARGGDATG
jgi:hypothetical protein